MKKTVLFLCALWSVPAFSQTAPDTVVVGAYFNSLYDLNLAEQSFKADIWIWYDYRNDSLDPIRSAEISNAKEVEFFMEDTEKLAGINWATHKARATLKKDYDLRHFPFDKQYLTIEIENALEDASLVVYVPDSVYSDYDKNIKLDGWVIRDFKTESKNKTYETTYGNPELTGSSTYSSVQITFTLARDGMGLFWKLFMGVYVAFLISIAVFFMGPENPERFGLIVGALFAGVANKYIVDSIMPQTIQFTLPDKIHNLTFVYIILHLVITIIAYRLSVKDQIKAGRKLDIISFVVSLISFIAFNIYLIGGAMSGH